MSLKHGPPNKPIAIPHQMSPLVLQSPAPLSTHLDGLFSLRSYQRYRFVHDISACTPPYSCGPDLFIQKATVRGRTIWKPKIEFNSVILETLTSFEKKFKTANSIFCLINQRSYIAFASYFLLFSWHHIPISHRFASIIFKVVLLSWTISSHGLCSSYNQSLEKGNIRDHCILYLFLLQFLYFLRCFSCFDFFVRCFLSLFSFWCGLRSSFEAY